MEQKVSILDRVATLVSMRPLQTGSPGHSSDTIPDFLCHSGWVTALLWTSAEGVGVLSPLLLWCLGTLQFSGSQTVTNKALEYTCMMAGEPLCALLFTWDHTHITSFSPSNSRTSLGYGMITSILQKRKLSNGELKPLAPSPITQELQAHTHHQVLRPYWESLADISGHAHTQTQAHTCALLQAPGKRVS